MKNALKTPPPKKPLWPARKHILLSLMTKSLFDVAFPDYSFTGEGGYFLMLEPSPSHPPIQTCVGAKRTGVPFTPRL